MRKFEVAPKPFDIIPFESNKEEKEITGHDRFTDKFTGTARLQLKTLAPLHIGSGMWEVINEEVVRDFVTVNGKEVIPGSSLKGAFRNVSETISRSCVCKTKQKYLSHGNLKECVVKNYNDGICPTCSIFGAMGYKGRVSFSDASLLNGNIGIAKIPSLYGPSTRAKIYTDYQGRFKGRKFYYHGRMSVGKEPIIVITADSRFEFSMRFENLCEDEFGLLLTSIGTLGGLIPKIGGAKPVCLGTVQVLMKALDIRNPARSFTSFKPRTERYEGDSLRHLLDGMGKKKNPLILEESLDELKRIWQYPPTRNCPSIVY